MSGALRGDPAELAAAGARIDAALETSATLARSREHLVAMAPAAGDPGAVSAVHEFLSNWTSGVAALEQSSSELARRLRQAAEQYEAADAAAGGPVPL